ncbi:hypothetical protein ACIBJC_06940 [Streptomyces sp. NPDC050509]|uniref:hypothetical protein n=1 Tax=Streptomyces sp. NPDC050509 TaxID=3365620 RepID=UPI003787CBA4
MKTFAHSLAVTAAVTALAATCAISLAGTVQAATAAGAVARQPATLQNEGDHGSDVTSMNFEEFGKKGAYDHAKEWDDGAGR